jgi:uncharacterized membrane protein YecN with MAPEG domain
MFVFLSFRVIGFRRKARIGLGDGGNRSLMRRQRVHGNFAEYAPLVIVLMALAELQGQPIWTIHLIGVCLVAGRLFHAYGVSQEPEMTKLRVAGMVLTFTALISGALSNLEPTGLVSAITGS